MPRECDSFKAKTIGALSSLEKKWPVLSERSRIVLKRLILITVNKGHKSVIVSVRDLAMGNAGWEALPFGRATVSRALKELQMARLIARARGPGRYDPTIMTLDTRRLHRGPRKDTKPRSARDVAGKGRVKEATGLRAGIHFKGSRGCVTKVLHNNPPSESCCFNLDSTNLKVVKTTSDASLMVQERTRWMKKVLPMATVEELLNQLPARNAERVKRVAEKRAKLPPRDDFGEAIWRCEVIASGLKPPSRWSPRERGQAQLVRNRVGEDYLAVLGHCARHWNAIIGTYFSWMTENPAPTYPDVAFFLSQSSLFLRAWSKHRVPRQEIELEAQARALAEEKGISLLAAAVEIGKLQGEARVRRATELVMSPYERLMAAQKGHNERAGD
jgi:hypothetical protein